LKGQKEFALEGMVVWRVADSGMDWINKDIIDRKMLESTRPMKKALWPVTLLATADSTTTKTKLYTKSLPRVASIDVIKCAVWSSPKFPLISGTESALSDVLGADSRSLNSITRVRYFLEAGTRAKILQTPKVFRPKVAWLAALMDGKIRSAYAKMVIWKCITASA
jgi:hypothetical protein